MLDSPGVLATEEHGAQDDPDILETLSRAEHGFSEFLLLLQACLHNALSVFPEASNNTSRAITETLLPNSRTRTALLESAASMNNLSQFTEQPSEDEAIGAWIAACASGTHTQMNHPQHFLHACVAFGKKVLDFPHETRLLLPLSGQSFAFVSTGETIEELVQDDVSAIESAELASLPAVVASSDLASECVAFLQGCMTSLLGKMTVEAGRKYFVLPNRAAVSEARAGGLAKIAACVVDVSCVAQHVGASLQEGEEGFLKVLLQTEFKGLTKLLLELTALSESHKQSVLSTLFPQSGLPNHVLVETTNSMVLQSCLVAFAEIHHLALVITAFVHLVAEPGYSYNDQGIKQNIANAIVQLRSMCAKAGDCLAKVPGELLHAHVFGSVFSPAIAKEWVEVVSACIVPEVATHFVRDSTVGLEKFTSDVHGKLPNYEHIFPQGMYIKHLAKQELLKHAHRDDWSNMSVRLFHAIGALVRVHTELHLAPPADSHPITKDSIAAARSVFEKSKVVVSILAHTHVIQCLTGREQRESAIKLLSKTHDVPQQLTVELQSIVGPSSMPPAALATPAKAGARRPRVT